MNAFSIWAVLGLDSSEYDKNLDIAKGKAGGIGKALATAAKVGAAAMTAAGAAVVALSKKAVESYGEYEQLVGGIETLFGAGGKSLEEYAESVGKSAGEVTSEYGDLLSAQNAMLANASKAWETAGLSANEYMETAITSAAAMVNAVGGDTRKAAELTDLSITDMSDNVNKMGTTMESIQNAYRGFSRGNFTMLDNLALGFAGTKEGMQELLDKARELSGVEYDIESYADIVQAIHVVQESMGITGTTAREASETISGSLSAMRSAWANLVTGFADDSADIGKLIDDVVDSASTAFGNILPVAEKALVGIADAVGHVAPAIAERLPQVAAEILPTLISTATTLVSALVAAMPEIIRALVDAAPQIINALVDTLVDMAPELVSLGFVLITALIQGITDSIPNLIAKAPVLIGNLISAIREQFPNIVLAGAQLIAQMLQGIGSMVAPLLQRVGDFMRGLVDTVKQKAQEFFAIGKNIVDGVWNGIKAKKEQFVQQVRNFFGGIVNGVKSFLGIHSPSTVFAGIGENMALGLGVGFDRDIAAVGKDMQGAVADITNGFDTASISYDASGAAKSAQAANYGASGSDLVAALQSALDGMGVYIGEKYVGKMVTDYQRNMTRRGAMA